MKRMSGFLGVALALVAGGASALGALAGVVNKQIICNNPGPTLLATINFDVPVQNAGGITISGKAVKTASFKGEIRWLQLIKTSNPLNTATAAGTPYFDPGELDPTGNDFPFYWNENLKGRDGNNYPGFWVQNKFPNANTLTMFDAPSRPTNTGVAIDWTAELSLVCWDKATGKIGWLWAANYGFNITAGGVNTAFGMTEIAAPAYLTQARLDARYGKGTYTLSTDCKDCTIPAPGAFGTLALTGVIAFRRRRAA